MKGFEINGLIKGKEVRFDDEYIHVKLEDGRIISTHIQWYEPLQKATIAQLKDYRLICLDTRVEWQSLDYHLNIENMLKVSLEVVA